MDETVKELVSEHSDKWLNKDDNYWLQRLMQEVGELASVLAGDHDDTVEHELLQVASIAINWLKKLAKPGYHIETQLNRFGLWEAFLYNNGIPVTWVSSYSTKDQAVIAIKKIGKVTTEATVGDGKDNWLRWSVLEAVRDESAT